MALPEWSGTLVIMRLMGGSGDGVDVRVVGYQFPDASDPGQRCSWHVVEGVAACMGGSWWFRYPALTCDESPRVAQWLRELAQAGGSAPEDRAGPSPLVLAFTEPNVSFAVVGWGPAGVVIDIGLDLEFAPPWRPRHRAGEPFLIRCELTPERLIQAAAEWDAEIAPYPEVATTE